MDSKDWEPDSASATCRLCNRKWGVFNYRRHHCRNCGKLVCFKCSQERMYLKITCKSPVRVCDKCVQNIRSTERPKLDQDDNLDNEEEDDVEDKGSDCISVISDGKCKATERPFRNILNNKNHPEVSRPEETPVLNDELETEDDEECKGSYREDFNENPENLRLEEAAIISSSHDEATIQAQDTFESLRTDASGNSDASEGTPLSLHQLHEASAPKLLKTSLEEPKRELLLSKFGNMAFSDEESAGTTPFSTRDSAAVIENSNVEVSSVAATAGSPENVPADTASGPFLDTNTDEQTAAGTTAESGSHKTHSSNDEEGVVDNSSKASDKPRPLHLTPKQGTLKMARRKSTSPANLSTDLPLEAGKSPMPTGGTVRRLSIYASAAAAAVDTSNSAEISTRTPFNSTVTPTEATAAVSAALNASKEEVEDSVTVPIIPTEVEDTVDASSDAADEEGVITVVEANEDDETAGEKTEPEENKAQGRKSGKNRRKGKGRK